MKRSRALSQTIFASAMVLTTASAHALPSLHKSNSGLAQINARAGSDDRLNGATFYADSNDNSRVIYVSPAARKTQQGQFQNGGVLIQCPTLQSMYDMAYSAPPQADWQSTALAGPYSPYFDLHFGNYLRNATLLEDILDTEVAITNICDDHPAECSEFYEAEGLYEARVDEVEFTEAEINRLNGFRDRAQDCLLLALLPTEEQACLDTMAEEAAERAAELPTAVAAYRDARREMLIAKDRYILAKAAFDALAPTREALEDLRFLLEGHFATIDALADRAFTRNVATLDSFESKMVGTARAMFSVYDQEVSAGRRAAAGSGYSVAELPLMNVTIGSDTADNETGTAITGTLASRGFTREMSKARGPNQIAVAGTERFFSTFRKGGQSLPIANIEPAATTAQTLFEVDVTQGSFCQGRTGGERSITRVAAGGSFWDVVRRRYVNRTTPLLAQPVGFSYDFFAAADPISVECSLDVDRFTREIRRRGSSGFLFWRRRWDDAQRTRVEEMGVSCEVTKAPSISFPDQADQDEYLEELRQAMEQEIMAEFVLNYAKSWNVANRGPDGSALEPTRPFRNIGYAVTSICGTNPFCYITGVVLKNLDELFGTKAGTTSNTDSLSGTITRSYKENSYRLLHQDQRVVMLEVRVN